MVLLEPKTYQIPVGATLVVARSQYVGQQQE